MGIFDKLFNPSSNVEEVKQHLERSEYFVKKGMLLEAMNEVRKAKEIDHNKIMRDDPEINAYLIKILNQIHEELF